MTTVENPAALRAAARQARTEQKGSVLAGWLSSTDHKIIGHMYLITSFVFFLFAGIMALLISWMRMSSAMIPANRKNTNDVIRYM